MNSEDRDIVLKGPIPPLVGSLLAQFIEWVVVHFIEVVYKWSLVISRNQVLILFQYLYVRTHIILCFIHVHRFYCSCSRPSTFP